MPAFNYTSLPQPTKFAHRGSSAYAPENTLAAFELAISHQSDAIEFDVKLSADSHVVVIHDLTVDRTTNTLPEKVADIVQKHGWDFHQRPHPCAGGDLQLV